jgi:hypothetical protein
MSVYTDRVCAICASAVTAQCTHTHNTRARTQIRHVASSECSFTPQPLLPFFSLYTDEDGLLFGGTGGELRDEGLRNEDNDLSISCIFELWLSDMNSG